MIPEAQPEFQEEKIRVPRGISMVSFQTMQLQILQNSFEDARNYHTNFTVIILKQFLG